MSAKGVCLSAVLLVLAASATAADRKPAKPGPTKPPVPSVTVAETAEAAPTGPATTQEIEAGINRAVELRVAKHYDEALAQLAAVEARVAGLDRSDPSVADARAEVGYQRGLVLQEAGRLADAAGAFDGVARDLPSTSVAGHARLSLAEVQIRLERPDDAFETYRSVLRENPKLASAALLGLAGLEESRGHAFEAARAYRNVVRNFPSAAETVSAKKSLGAVCGRLLEGKPSSTLLEEIVARGDCLMDVNRAPEAEALYQAALKRRMPAEERVSLLMALGQALDAQDRTAASERVYRQVVKLTPGTPEAAYAQMTIVQGFLDRGRLSEAARELERIVKNYPGTPAQAQAQFEAGSVYEALRNPKKAEEAYRKVLEFAPQSPWGVEAQQCLVRLVEQKP